MAPKVDQCCCGCPLKMGTISIALYHVVISTVILIVVPLMLYDKYNSAEKPVNATNITDHSKTGGGKVIGKNKDEEKKRANHEFLEDGIKGLYILIITLFSLNMIINLLLIIGAMKGKSLLVNIWIIANSVFLMISIVMFVINLFMTFLDPDPPLRSMGCSFVSIVTTSYFIVVVNSFYHQLDHREVAPHSDRVPPIIFIIDPPPPEPDPPPPPYPTDYDPFHSIELHPPPAK